jgi:hypothetical protein
MTNNSYGRPVISGDVTEVQQAYDLFKDRLQALLDAMVAEDYLRPQDAASMRPDDDIEMALFELADLVQRGSSE